MINFYLGMFVLIVLALVFVLWPLLRSLRNSSRENDAGADTGRQAANIALYEHQLRDLQGQLTAKEITHDQFDDMKLELERNLLDDYRFPAQQQPTVGNRYYYWVAMLAVLPVAVIIIYQSLGAFPAWQLGQSLQQQARLQQQLLHTNDSAVVAELDALNTALIPALKAYLLKKPDDLEMKVFLARQAMSLGHYDDAIREYQQVLARQPDASVIMAELAQAIFVQADNRAVPIVGILAQRSLAIEPDNLMALGLAGIFAFQQADYQQAITHWERAVSLQPGSSANAQALLQGIAQARARSAATASAPAAAAQPSATDGHQGSEAVAAEEAVRVAVSLAEQVPVEPDHAVFIYARAWQGSPMPLAIARLQASQLPLTLTLDESMAMAPGMTVATVDQLELVARLSPSGNARAQAGDWEVTLGPVSAKAGLSTVYPLVIASPFVP